MNTAKDLHSSYRLQTIGRAFVQRSLEGYMSAAGSFKFQGYDDASLL